MPTDATAAAASLVPRAALILLAGLGATGCPARSASIELRFPNEAARRATVRLDVEVFSAEASLASGGRRDCEAVLGTTAAARAQLGVPEQAFYTCPVEEDGSCPPGWFEEARPLSIPTGRSLVYVQGFASLEASAPLILEGCTAELDTGSSDGTDRVPVNLQVVIPPSARLVLAGTNRLVGPPGVRSDLPARVRVEVDTPGSGRGSYGLPGITVRFSARGGPKLADGRVETAVADTNREGYAEVPVWFGDADGSGFVEAVAEALEEAAGSSGGRVELVVSTLAPVEFTVASSAVGASLGRPIGIAVGRWSPGGPMGVAALGCAGGGERGCVAGTGAEPPFGRSRLAAWTVADGSLSPLGEVALGILPTDVAFVGPAEGLAVAVSEARNEFCQDRVCDDPATCPCFATQAGTPCPCEGGVVQLLGAGEGGLRGPVRQTLTASNAVALAGYRGIGGAPRVAVAGQGRSRNERPCADVAACLRSDLPECLSQPERCGCPPQEACECVGCVDFEEAGTCVARDRMVDMVELAGGASFNHEGCQRRILTCNAEAPEELEGNRCRCLGPEDRVARCNQTDVCGCRVPHRIQTGPKNAPSLPFDVAPADLSASTSGVDLVVASESGLELFEQRSERFAWEQRPQVNAPIDRVAVSNFDPGAEEAAGGAALDDAAWIAAGPCLGGVSYAEQCPVVLSVPDSAGCFGLYVSDGLDSLLVSVNRRNSSRCRRFELPAAPRDLCAGDFDGNGTADLALSLEGATDLRIHLGDGYGGLRFEPLSAVLPPGGTAGPIACGDLDGDGRDEAVVWAAEGGWLAVVRRRD